VSLAALIVTQWAEYGIPFATLCRAPTGVSTVSEDCHITASGAVPHVLYQPSRILPAPSTPSTCARPVHHLLRKLLLILRAATGSMVSVTARSSPHPARRLGQVAPLRHFQSMSVGDNFSKTHT